MTDPAARSARARFQSGLLAWLRQPGDAAGLREMIAVLRELAEHDRGVGRGVLWRSAEAFLASLLDGSLKSDDGARQMCRRIERHLGAVARDEKLADTQLRDELFAFISGKVPAAPTAANSVQLVAGLQKAIGGSLTRTADLLPLIAGGRPPRYAESAVAEWRSAVGAVDDAWHAFSRSQIADSRAQTTALVAAALKINAPACLQLAEALAAACASAEELAARDHPAIRAAIASALEIAGDRDGPNHTHFDQRTRIAVTRLIKAEEEIHRPLRSGRPQIDVASDGADASSVEKPVTLG